jgi:hypothetical protein
MSSPVSFLKFAAMTYLQLPVFKVNLFGSMEDGMVFLMTFTVDYEDLYDDCPDLDPDVSAL